MSKITRKSIAASLAILLLAAALMAIAITPTAADDYSEDAALASAQAMFDELAPFSDTAAGSKTDLQNTFIGTLVDCNGVALTGYNVILLQGKDGEQVARTDREGKFVFILLSESNYTLVLQDKNYKEIARKGFKLEEGKIASASVNKITFAHGTYTFSVTVTLDANNNIIFGAPVACSVPAVKPAVVAKAKGSAPYTK
ncbi:MAG: carboxypeptidase-like regulatory domain-containing protein [Clostridia bacterium]|nr:carboxypeptidase-like regulatory domain-containing protein [Clostridia bacterium]